MHTNCYWNRFIFDRHRATNCLHVFSDTMYIQFVSRIEPFLAYLSLQNKKSRNNKIRRITLSFCRQEIHFTELFNAIPSNHNSPSMAIIPIECSWKVPNRLPVSPTLHFICFPRWGKYHVPQNVYLVGYNSRVYGSIFLYYFIYFFLFARPLFLSNNS